MPHTLSHHDHEHLVDVPTPIMNLTHVRCSIVWFVSPFSSRARIRCRDVHARRLDVWLMLLRTWLVALGVYPVTWPFDRMPGKISISSSISFIPTEFLLSIVSWKGWISNQFLIFGRQRWSHTPSCDEHKRDDVALDSIENRRDRNGAFRT